MQDVGRDDEQIPGLKMEQLIVDDIVHMAAREEKHFVKFMVVRRDLVIVRVEGMLDFEITLGHVVLVQPVGLFFVPFSHSSFLLWFCIYCPIFCTLLYASMIYPIQ